MGDAALWAGAALAATAAGGALLLRDPRHRVAAMALALALAPVLIAADHWEDARFRDLRDSPALLVAGLVLGGSLLAALAVLFRRLPQALPLLAFAALPFRVPVEAGGEDAYLLLPLYAVIAAGVLAEVVGAVRPLGRGEHEPDGTPESTPASRSLTATAARWLPAALAGWVVLYAVQAAYSDDLSKAVENLAFFLVPFAVLAALLLRARWTPRLLTLLLAVVVAEALLFAAVGFAQYALRELFWNDAIIAANEIHSYFRVNSLFWDPNIFGRYLALALIAVAAVMLWTRSARGVGAAGVIALVLAAALAITFSQSSLIALLAGLAVLAALRWSVRWTVAVCLVVAVAGLAWIAISDGSVQTSGRDELIEGGLELASEQPVVGHGSGSFQKEFERDSRFGGEGAASGLAHGAGDGRGRAGRDRAPRLPGGDRSRDRRARPPDRALGARSAGRGRRSGRRRRPRDRDGTGRPRRRLGGNGRPQPLLRGLLHRPDHLGAPRGRPRPGEASLAMFDYLRRLASTGAAYTASSVLSKLIAVALLPLYTRHLSPSDYGAAEVMVVAVIATSIVIRLGVIEALMRFYYLGGEDRDQVVRTGFASLFWTATAGALVALPFAEPISEALLDSSQPDLVRIAIGGLWVFTLYEYLVALFRLDERAKAYFVFTIANVLLAIPLTVWLVVIEDEGARGLLLGTYAGAVPFLAYLVWEQRRRLGLVPDLALLRRLFRFGLPTMPAELSLYSLQFIDRIIIVRLAGLAEAGLYALAIRFAQGVNVLVRGFQLAWPPLAYSVTDDAEAKRVYALVVTWFAAACAFVVVGFWLLSRWIVRLLAAPEYFESFEAIGLLTTGVTLYALYLVLVVVLGRTGRTEFNFPADRDRHRRQHRAQPGAGAAARDRRRRARPRRLIRRRVRRSCTGSPSASSRCRTTGAGWRSWSGSPPRWSRPASSCSRPRARSGCSVAPRSGSRSRSSSTSPAS